MNLLANVVAPFIAAFLASFGRLARPSRIMCDSIARSLEGQSCWAKTVRLVHNLGIVVEFNPAPTQRMLAASLGVNLVELDVAIVRCAPTLPERYHTRLQAMVGAAQNEAVKLILQTVPQDIRAKHMEALVAACERCPPPQAALIREDARRGHRQGYESYDNAR